MVAFFVNLFFYCVGLVAEFKLKTQRTRWPSIIKRFISLFGILVVALITIILHPVLGFVTFIMWALITMKAIINLFEEILHRCLNKAETHSSRIQENGSSCSLGIQGNDSLHLGINDNSPGIQANDSSHLGVNDSSPRIQANDSSPKIQENDSSHSGANDNSPEIHENDSSRMGENDSLEEEKWHVYMQGT